MLVMKFGGSSISSAENIRKVRSIISSKKDNYVIVVSAFAGTTDKLQKLATLSMTSGHHDVLESLKVFHINIVRDLIDLSNQSDSMILIQQKFNELSDLCSGVAILQELSDKTLARILSTGEYLSSTILHRFLKQEGIDLHYLDSGSLIKANGSFLNAEVDEELTDAALSKAVKSYQNYIAPGFVSSNLKNEITLLGRGGSDYTASIISGSVGAEKLEIWTDVSGMLNADPSLVKSARSINELSYNEAFELAHFGADVLYPPAVRPVMQKGIPVFLKNTFHPEMDGTLIASKDNGNKDNIIGISSRSGISLLNISGVGLAGSKGTARRVFQSMETAEVNVILITQCSSEHSICIGVKDTEAEKAVGTLKEEFNDEIKKLLVDEIEISGDYSIIALVGDQMKKRAGLSGKAFGVLGENGINITAIAQGSSERNISLVIDKRDEKKAVNVLHERFFRGSTKKVHLFIAGVGNVGSQFLKIIEQQYCKLYQDKKIDLKIVGVANSSKMLVNEDGLDYDSIGSLREDGIPYQDFGDFVEIMRSMNKRNSIFIDNTASEIVSSHYAEILGMSISVVACNKIACSGDYVHYKELIGQAFEKNCQFKYETCVGAALPVIKTIQDLILSGDRITKIDAVLSGSLNFIFNNYNTEETFEEVVQKAGKEGYTEPNPMIDLSGLDVMRKILILAREAGWEFEMDDVISNSFLPPDCLSNGNVDEIYSSLHRNEEYFRNLYLDAFKQGKKLKFVASADDSIARVGLEAIGADSPFYQLEGKDNIITINSERYPDEPLVIKGAGAGAELTASGVFSDIMLIVNK